MIFQIVLFMVLGLACAVAGIWGGRHPDFQRKFRPVVPYLYILQAVYVGYTAEKRHAWWFVFPLVFLILAVIEFVRQWRISRGRR